MFNVFNLRWTHGVKSFQRKEQSSSIRTGLDGFATLGRQEESRLCLSNNGLPTDTVGSFSWWSETTS